MTLPSCKQALTNLSLSKSLGAVISGRYFRHPVSLAKKIMNESNHCALSGNGAKHFAEKKEFPTCTAKELISEQARRRAKWMDTTVDDKKLKENVDVANEQASVTVGQEDYEHSSTRRPQGELQDETSSDTVSAVAMDAHGNLACAMSTGTCNSTCEVYKCDIIQ